MKFFIGNVLALQLLLSVFVHCAFAQESSSKKRAYDVAVGQAAETLRIATEQGHIELVFASDVIVGIETNAIKGRFRAQDALGRMLKGTPLVAVPVSGANAYGILTRAKKGGNFPERSENLTQNTLSKELENQSEMNLPEENKKTIGGFFKGLLALAVAAGPTLSAQDDSGSEENIYELSPFTVDAAADTGYRATTTLAGTRLKTNLKDVGASVSVLTKEMFEDTGATDAQTILSYALGAEVGGSQGNFAGGDGGVNGQRSEQDANRTNPQQAQRVRGLAVAQLTRNYFESDIAFDSYNTDRITINRGPNSLLFGIGSAGGVINNSSKQASVSKDFGEVGFRFSHRGSHRVTIDYNKVLVEGRLAIRLAALNETMEYKQKPAFDDKERIYLALNAVISKNENSNMLDATTLRANFEDGSTESNPPNVTPPGDGISSWFSTLDPALQQLTGTTFPSWITDGSFEPKFTVDGRGFNEEGVPLGTLESEVKGSLGIPYFIQHVLQFSDSSGPPSIQGTDLNGGVSRAIYGFGGRPRRTFDTFQTNSYFAQTYLPGFRTASLPTSVFDNRNLLLSGNTNRVEHDFDAKNFVFEQTFFNSRAGIELALDSQSYSTFANLPFGGQGNGAVGRIGFSDVRVDVMEVLSNDEPNRVQDNFLPLSPHAAFLLSQ